MFLEITYIQFLLSLSLSLSLSLTEPHAQSLLTKVILGTDHSQFLQYSLLRIR
jgi:hypothetical protein